MTTQRPTKVIHNIETNVIEEIELTDEEIAHFEEQVKIQQEQQKVYEAEEAARQALKASAKAKLVAGQPLTEEEADTLVI